MTSLKTSIKTITYLSDIGCLEIQGASLVYQALYQAELQVPQDIAVIGYDDIELASFMTPPLTTIHQPKDELGELAIDVLIHRITQPTLQQQRLQLTPILMERGSA
jgi:LacI family transcriptional regulator